MRIIFFLIIIFLAVPVAAHSATVDIPVPFTSQAPAVNWKEPWKNACEETAIAMIAAYYAGDRSERLKPTTARAAILALFKIKNKSFGWSLDEDADKIVKIINNSYSWQARVVENPSIPDIQAEIDAGRPVIVPAYGRTLKNPHFRKPRRII